uniref:Uncharacterized protein n=1 Tax=Oryza meridionalis TaxID=40149 RepID=A0A0E0DRH5_9ORYZ
MGCFISFNFNTTTPEEPHCLGGARQYPMWQPMKPVAPMTRTEIPHPLARLTRAKARTFFS